MPLCLFPTDESDVATLAFSVQEPGVRQRNLMYHDLDLPDWMDNRVWRLACGTWGGVKSTEARLGQLIKSTSSSTMKHTRLRIPSQARHDGYGAVLLLSAPNGGVPAWANTLHLLQDEAHEQPVEEIADKAASWSVPKEELETRRHQF